MIKPTKEQKYDFIQEHISKLKKKEKVNVIMEGRLYEVKFIGDRDEVVFFEDELSGLSAEKGADV